MVDAFRIRAQGSGLGIQGPWTRTQQPLEPLADGAEHCSDAVVHLHALEPGPDIVDLDQESAAAIPAVPALHCLSRRIQHPCPYQRS
eukprot:1029298-Rhodomonas_salina.3